MKLIVEIQMENAAFDPVNGGEAAHILSDLADAISDRDLDCTDKGRVMDSNGNSVGKWRVVNS
jgi:hypothetical protein